MRKIMMFAGISAALGAAAPASAQWAQFHEWDFCTANALSVCMNFTLNRETGTDNYRLRVTYVSTAGFNLNPLRPTTLIFDPPDNRSLNLTVPKARIGDDGVGSMAQALLRVDGMGLLNVRFMIDQER